MISVIIPVYNVQDFIVKCLESVASQTYKGALECLIIDDCGCDDSVSLAENFISSYNGNTVFRIIHHEMNKGLSAARNTGIRESKGEWLFFLDSDDWIIPECIELMMECVANHPDVELVQGGVLSNDDGFAKWLSIENKQNVPDYSNNRDWINLMLLRQEILVVTAWNKLIRRDIVLDNDLFFEEGALNEDEMWSFLLSKFIKVVAICKRNTYYYNIRAGSIIKNIDKIRANYPVILEYLINYIGGKYKRREIVRISQMILLFQQYNVTNEQREKFRKIKIRLIKKADVFYSLILLALFFMPSNISNRANEFLVNKEKLV